MGILPKLQLPFRKKKNWVITDVVIADPQPVPSELKEKLTPKVIEKLLLGTTTYVWEDQDTGEIHKEEFLGSNETPLKQALDRADQWGKYDIQYGNKRFVIIRLGENQETLLPMSSNQETQTSPQPIVDISKLPVR